MVLWDGWEVGSYRKVIHCIPRLQDSLQQEKSLPIVTEDGHIQAIEKEPFVTIIQCLLISVIIEN